MKIGIIGAGSIGCYFAALFSRAGEQVHLLARGANLEFLKEHEITIEEGTVSWKQKVPAAGTPEEIGECDLVIISVKSFDTESAGKLAKPLVGKGTTVMAFQNGIDNEETLGRILGAEAILPCLVRTGATRADFGTIQILWPGKVEFGELSGEKTERVHGMTELFEKSQVAYIIQEDIRKAQWKKFLWNVGFNQVCAITGQDCGTAVACVETKALIESAAKEAVLAGKSEGVSLAEADATGITALHPSLEKFKPSMLQDRLAARRMEIESFGGTIVRLGEKHKISTPTNCSLLSLLRGIDSVRAEQK